jgi:hypothetical protein
MRRLIATLMGAGVLAVASAGTASAGNGPPHIDFYVDGVQYATVGTPTDLSGTGAPASSFQPIYALGGDLLNVTTAAPGDPGYRGGRWMVFPVTWNVTPYQITSDEQLFAAQTAGDLTVATAPVKEFECPVIPVH